jgi:23S rRNA (guanosine2251-2'-O)-methyltransferase
VNKTYRKNNNSFQKSRTRSQQANRAATVTGGPAIMGRNTVREVLRLEPARISKIIISGQDHDKDKAFQSILELVKKHDIEIQRKDKSFLNELVGSDSHQGVIAILKERNRVGLKESLRAHSGKEKSLILILDSIEDPQNLGAILRAAECFAVDAVIISVNRGTAITPSVSKASVGASELVDIIQVSNLADTVRKLKEDNYWIVAADAREEAKSLKDFEFPGRTVILLGSEGRGLQELLRKEADFIVSIPLFGRISSLNVSQAASIFLAHYRLQVS